MKGLSEGLNLRIQASCHKKLLEISWWVVAESQMRKIMANSFLPENPLFVQLDLMTTHYNVLAGSTQFPLFIKELVGSS